ncbi:unnamed protein product [Rhizophagus irregularis]|nr:unnamed protein product [Rhizophagus irregularis]
MEYSKIIGDTYHRKYSLTGIIDNKGKMYLWGGLDIRTNVNSDMLILDTVNLVWVKEVLHQLEATSGNIPSGRSGFTAVLGLDGQRVIIYGGSSDSTDSSLYELNLINYEWRNGYNRSIENDILLLDISNVNEYIWTNEFYFNSLPLPSKIEPSSINKSLIIGVIGVIIGNLGWFLVLSNFIEYRRNKNRSKDDDNDQVENKFIITDKK